MYIVTGGAGFIGSTFVRKLNQEGIDEILIVDELGHDEKWKNLRKAKYFDFVHKNQFLQSIVNDQLPRDIKAIVHMGACSTTTETDADYMMRNNYEYTRTLADFAVRNDIRFIYASSAATYGDGKQGYVDDEDQLEGLMPLNIYGYSKHVFDLYAQKSGYLNQIAGLKLFNVFGPNEYHKTGMHSHVYRAFHQISETGKTSLFKSYLPEYADGEQKRDFVYVKDCNEVIWWLLRNRSASGIFNLGTGKARSWNDLAKAVFTATEKPEQIEYIEMPDTLRRQYQYFTEADMTRLKESGCPVKFRSLEESVSDYVANHLQNSDIYC